MADAHRRNFFIIWCWNLLLFFVREIVLRGLILILNIGLFSITLYRLVGQLLYRIGRVDNATGVTLYRRHYSYSTSRQAMTPIIPFPFKLAVFRTQPQAGQGKWENCYVAIFDHPENPMPVESHGSNIELLPRFCPEALNEIDKTLKDLNETQQLDGYRWYIKSIHIENGTMQGKFWISSLGFSIVFAMQDRMGAFKAAFREPEPIAPSSVVSPPRTLMGTLKDLNPPGY